jgi:hypothetical protein
MDNIQNNGHSYHLNNIWWFRSCLAETSPHLQHKDQRFEAAQGNDRSLFETHKYTMWLKCTFIILKQVVQIMTSALKV